MPEHYRTLFEIAVHPDVAARWEPSSHGETFESWVDRLGRGVFCQYAVQIADSARPVDGLVRCYGANFRHGTAQVALFMAPNRHNTGIGLRAMALLIDSLFRRYAFRKLYAETLEYNLPSFGSGRSRFFEVEGVLRAHETHDGRPWDCYILAVHREAWMSGGAKVAMRLRAPAQPVVVAAENGP